MIVLRNVTAGKQLGGEIFKVESGLGVAQPPACIVSYQKSICWWVCDLRVQAR